MNCSDAQEYFIDDHDGSLPADKADQLRAHLARCPACQRAWSDLQEITRQLDTLVDTPEPSPRLREQFNAMVAAETPAADAPNPFALARGRFDRFLAALLPPRPALQFAFALALLCAGWLASRQFWAQPPTPLPADAALRQELAALRTQVDSMGQLVTYSLVQQQSTSARLRAVLATMDLKNPDRKVLTDLVGSLVFDPSLNVRLSAVEALAQHADDALVRAGVLTALPRETAPLVQLAMIELLATAGDHAALPVFEKLSRDTAIDRNVRVAARRAVAALRLPDSGASQSLTKFDHPHQPSAT